MSKRKWQLLSVFVVLVVAFFALSGVIQAQIQSQTQSTFRARDPGVQSENRGTGRPIGGLTIDEKEMFDVGLEDFAEEEDVPDGVGPRFNFVGCAGCHSQPAVGGTSPALNPLFRVIGDLGFTRNVIPSFIRRDGPIREARFQFNPDGSRDGGVHALFVISGHRQAPGCNIQQEDFERQVRNNNIIFRIPTPVFGAGLIEQITDSAILANLSRRLGQQGRPRHQRARRRNRNGNDGKISRFGWKAQNQSLLLFSGEAYNVEMGITNELFQIERDETPSCQFATVPNDVTPSVRQIGAIENFANFQRFLAPAKASLDSAGRFDRRSPAAASNSAMSAAPFATRRALEDRQYHRGRPGEPDRESVLRPGASRHGARARRRRPPGRGPG